MTRDVLAMQCILSFIINSNKGFGNHALFSNNLYLLGKEHKNELVWFAFYFARFRIKVFLDSYPHRVRQRCN